MEIYGFSLLKGGDKDDLATKRPARFTRAYH